MADFTVRQGDDFTISDTLEDSAGNAVDIAGATVAFTLIPIDGGTPKINAADAANSQNGDGSDGSKGKVLFAGSSASSDTAGYFLGAWIVTYSDGDVQTFPNGGYILVQVTATAPVPSETRFADSTDLEQRLGVAFSSDEHVRANILLALASGIIQQRFRQTVAFVAGDVYTRPGDYDDRIRLPERPVGNVSSVVLDGTELVNGTNFYVDRDELVRLNWNAVVQDSSFGLPWAGWGFPWWQLVVTYDHGYETIPDLVKTVCMEMVVRVWVNPGSVARETVGNTVTIYDNMRYSPTGMLLTDSEDKTLRKLLRRHSDSIQLR